MNPPTVLMVGTGEYTTGFVHGAESSSDKGAGVVALTLFDLRSQGLTGDLLMAGTNGTKFPAIRTHLDSAIGQRYAGLDTSFTSFPADDVSRDPDAWLSALDRLSPGDVVTVFTPDDTHHAIALAALRKKCHVLVAKPIVQALDKHLELIEIAAENGVLCAMEVHKRWDPIYADARDRIRQLGHFGHFAAYMSQPKSQLETFRAWAGKSSDISYYLNAHHVDFLQWAVGHQARPVSVTAIASNGVARDRDLPTEDSITLATTWEIPGTDRTATALFTSSWIAPKSDVHSQQHFFYQGESGEVRVDQAHRGYNIATDEAGYASPNPLFMKYTPDASGHFAGRSAYGYRSIADFVEAAASVNSGASESKDWDHQLATAATTATVTAILEAGRRSLDKGSTPVGIHYDHSSGLPVELS
ncbi:Gfo/Idh/MocA family protein [Haloferula sp.]|uniref:Gfo/Idh/MocA family protein n=1 Tax=Haloferula sp. TaxID=2497595 RepID=UPI00329EAEDA